MPSLRELQEAMGAAVDGDPSRAASLVFENGIAPEIRLDVYANNAWCAFRNTLALEFPTVARLGGDDWFRGTAREYRQRHPSRAGDLHHVGERFPEFLSGVLAGTGYEVIADVAALEWAFQEVLLASPATPLDLTALASVAPAEIRFALAPDCRLFASAYPVIDVWNAHRDPDAEPAPVDLAAGAQRVLVRRAGADVEFRRLDAAHHALLAALDGGAPLAEAAERAFACDPEFDLAGALQRDVALAVLTSPRNPH
jgi:hypothetical protein